MTDPTGGLPPPQGSAPPPQGNWQTPPPPGAVPPPQGGGNWQTPPPTPAPGGFQTAPVAAEPGPAPGIMYADLTSRIIAYVIDAIGLGIVWSVVWSVIVGSLLLTSGFGMLLVAGVVLGLIWAAGSAAYFVYTWTKMRASLGQRVMKLETVNAGDGATLTQNQAIKRWAFLFGPAAAGIVLGNILGLIGPLLSLLAFGYECYLLYTTSQSSKRQGFHDVQAATVVVKRVA
jgi:uncharacterized RDD family membrane protein YckC